MLDALHVTESPARMAAVIRLQIPQMDLPSVMGPAIDELLAALKAQDIIPAGPVFNHYLSMDGGMFDFEVGVPILTPVAPAGRVRPGQLPEAKVARATYTGSYAGLHHAWREFGERAKGQGLKPGGNFWESFVFGPESNPDSSTWRTELNQPLLE
jgi:effector-binding domain-containing protein